MDLISGSSTLRVWTRKNASTNLRHNPQTPGSSFTDLPTQTSLPGLAVQIIGRIIASMRWNSKPDALKAILNPKHFNLMKLEAFRNGKNPVKLKKTLGLVDKFGVAADILLAAFKLGCCRQHSQSLSVTTHHSRLGGGHSAPEQRTLRGHDKCVDCLSRHSTGIDCYRCWVACSNSLSLMCRYHFACRHLA
jgi:hypothetical protein